MRSFTSPRVLALHLTRQLHPEPLREHPIAANPKTGHTAAPSLGLTGLTASPIFLARFWRGGDKWVEKPTFLFPEATVKA
jgi:hypothetical protein